MLRKIVYDAYHNNFIDKAKKLKDEYKARAKKRKMSAPNTAFGEDLTVGGQLKSIQEYNEILDLKREEKVRKAAEREQNRRRKIVTESKHLSEAQDILRQCSKRSDADKNLRKRHLIALLRSVCAPPELLKDTVAKSQMLQAYWSRVPWTYDSDSDVSDMNIVLLHHLTYHASSS